MRQNKPLFKPKTKNLLLIGVMFFSLWPALLLGFTWQDDPPHAQWRDPSSRISWYDDGLIAQQREQAPEETPLPGVSCQAEVIIGELNVRVGPSRYYDPPVGILNSGDRVLIVGKNPEESWWRIKFSHDGHDYAWIAGTVEGTVYSQTVGDCENISVVQNFPPPPDGELAVTGTPTPTNTASLTITIANTHTHLPTPAHTPVEAADMSSAFENEAEESISSFPSDIGESRSAALPRTGFWLWRVLLLVPFVIYGIFATLEWIKYFHISREYQAFGPPTGPETGKGTDPNAPSPTQNVDELQEELQSERRAHRETKMQLDKISRGKSREIENLHRQNDSLQHSLKDKKDRYRQLLGTYEKTRKEASTLHRENIQLSTSLAQLESVYEETFAECEELREQIDTYAKDAEQANILNRENLELRQQLGEYLSHLEDRDRRIEDLEGDLHIVGNERLQLLEELEGFRRDKVSRYDLSEGGPQHYMLVQDYMYLEQIFHEISLEIMALQYTPDELTTREERQTRAEIKSALANDIFIYGMSLLQSWKEATTTNRNDVTAKVLEKICEDLNSLVTPNTMPCQLCEHCEDLVGKSIELMIQIMTTDPPGNLSMADRGAAFNPDIHKALPGCEEGGFVLMPVYPAYSVGERIYEKALVFTLPNPPDEIKSSRTRRFNH